VALLRVLYIVMVTAECNMACSYCGGSLVTMPRDISYDLEDLAAFIGQDEDDETIVALYGGEPLLRPQRVHELLDMLPADRWVLQTNGFYIERLGEHVHDFDSILLSIDGRQATTDRYRGEGCHDRVMQARRWLTMQEYEGDIVARMAASRHTDIYEDVMYLLRFFPHVHWQLDAVWSPLWELPAFRRWTKQSYMPGVEHLARVWTEHLHRGEVLGIVPFLGVARRLIRGGTGLPCGAGRSAVSITTDGRVIGCPIAAEFDWNQMGDFDDVQCIDIGEPCTSCDIYTVCGGRCLFTYKERLWGDEGFTLLCRLTRHLVEHVRAALPLVESMLPDHERDLLYPPFNNTTEIIP
jgi:putative peptide-modifying radical SAM enzyme